MEHQHSDDCCTEHQPSLLDRVVLPASMSTPSILFALNWVKSHEATFKRWVWKVGLAFPALLYVIHTIVHVGCAIIGIPCPL